MEGNFKDETVDKLLGQHLILIAKRSIPDRRRYSMRMGLASHDARLWELACGPATGRFVVQEVNIIKDNEYYQIVSNAPASGCLSIQQWILSVLKDREVEVCRIEIGGQVCNNLRLPIMQFLPMHNGNVRIWTKSSKWNEAENDPENTQPRPKNTESRQMEGIEEDDEYRPNKINAKLAVIVRVHIEKDENILILRPGTLVATTEADLRGDRKWE